MFCITAALMIGTAGLPHVIMLFYGQKCPCSNVKSAYWTLSFIAVTYLTAPAPAFSTERISTRKSIRKNTSKHQNGSRIKAQGMIAWVDKNQDGIMQYRAGEVFAGKPVYLDNADDEDGPRKISNEINYESENEVYYDKDIIVLANRNGWSAFMGNVA